MISQTGLSTLAVLLYTAPLQSLVLVILSRVTISISWQISSSLDVDSDSILSLSISLNLSLIFLSSSLLFLLLPRRRWPRLGRGGLSSPPRSSSACSASTGTSWGTSGPRGRSPPRAWTQQGAGQRTGFFSLRPRVRGAGTGAKEWRGAAAASSAPGCLEADILSVMVIGAGLGGSAQLVHKVSGPEIVT